MDKAQEMLVAIAKVKAVHGLDAAVRFAEVEYGWAPQANRESPISMIKSIAWDDEYLLQ